MSNKTKFEIQNCIFAVLLICFWVYIQTHFDAFSWAQDSMNFMSIIFFLIILVLVIILFVRTFDDDFHDTDDYENYLIYKRLPKIRFKKGLIALAVLIFIIYYALGLITPFKNIYNASVVYTKTYEQKTNEKLGFYDKLWKIYFQKEKITNLNKDVFIQVSRIIMENRKDGQAITWKWISENQNIPYTEFTKFYQDLSTFIEGQRESYYALEKDCQAVAVAHNLLIDTFPNNMYNKIVGRPHINFQYGFLSDSTNKVFTTKTENLH